MRIAVTYENGEVFQHFGHTEQFKVYEVEDSKVVSSEILGSDGSGHEALATLLRERSIDVLICDGIGGGAPYIGQFAETRPDWYVATGFQKWGMTGSMVSAMLLRDRIDGVEKPNAAVFDPSRFDAKALAGVAGETGHAIKGLTKHFFQIPGELSKAIPPNHGEIVFLGGEKLGVYRDADGRLWPVSVYCPHLGYQLEWNPDELSWDCPCHGSRFDRFGNRISGPAQTPISPVRES